MAAQNNTNRTSFFDTITIPNYSIHKLDEAKEWFARIPTDSRFENHIRQALSAFEALEWFDERYPTKKLEDFLFDEEGTPFDMCIRPIILKGSEWKQIIELISDIDPTDESWALIDNPSDYSGEYIRIGRECVPSYGTLRDERAIGGFYCSSINDDGLYIIKFFTSPDCINATWILRRVDSGNTSTSLCGYRVNELIDLLFPSQEE